MTVLSAIDARLGRDTRPDDAPDRVAVATDDGTGGWEAIDDPTRSPMSPRGSTRSAMRNEYGRSSNLAADRLEKSEGGDTKILELPGGLTAAQELFQGLSGGGVDVTPPGHPGRLVELAGGSLVE